MPPRPKIKPRQVAERPVADGASGKRRMGDSSQPSGPTQPAPWQALEPPRSHSRSNGRPKTDVESTLHQVR